MAQQQPPPVPLAGEGGGHNYYALARVSRRRQSVRQLDLPVISNVYLSLPLRQPNLIPEKKTKSVRVAPGKQTNRQTKNYYYYTYTYSSLNQIERFLYAEQVYSRMAKFISHIC